MSDRAREGEETLPPRAPKSVKPATMLWAQLWDATPRIGLFLTNLVPQHRGFDRLRQQHPAVVAPSTRLVRPQSRFPWSGSFWG